MTKQLDLFDQTTLANYIVGTKEWKKANYNELIKLPYEEVKKLDNYYFDLYDTKQPSTEEYWTHIVIIDVLHSYYFKEFQKDYPKILFGKREIKYL